MKKGFTLIELIVVIGMLIAIGAIIVANIGGRRTNTDILATTRQIATLLRQAQSDSMAQEGNLTWGVHFSNTTSSLPFYAIFSGSYATGTITGQYELPASVAYRTSSIASGGTLDVTFAQISGAASVSTTILLYMPNENTAFSSTIYVASSGAVSY